MQTNPLPMIDRDGAYVFDTYRIAGSKGNVEMGKPPRDVYAREMAATFPELPPVAALEMHAPVPGMPKLGPPVRRTGSLDYDHGYERFKAITRRNSF